MTKLKALFRDERGASLVEYSVLLGLITAALLSTILLVQGKILDIWKGLNTALTPPATP